MTEPTKPCECKQCRDRGVKRYTRVATDGMRCVLELDADGDACIMWQERSGHDSWTLTSSVALAAHEMAWLAACVGASDG